MYQKTIKSAITIQGIGLHSGVLTTMVLKPANPNTGIVFVRTDITNGNNTIPALYNNVVNTTLATVIANSSGASVSTIEHLFFALSVMQIDNLIIEINNKEVPILDGSAIVFINQIKKVGLSQQNQPKQILEILQPIEVKSDNFHVKLKPSSTSTFTVLIDFKDKVIGRQIASFNFANTNDINLISNARTFCSAAEVEYLRSKGLALGGSLDNAIVVDETKVLNPEGLRYNNEFARHKVLDAIGDIYLAGYYIKGDFYGYKCGHNSNNLLLRNLFSNPNNYKITSLANTNTVFSSNKLATVV